MTPLSTKHSELSKQISIRWVDHLSSLQSPSVNIRRIREEFEKLIKPYDDESTILFTHPIWTLVRKYAQDQTTCSLHAIEYYLWLLNNPYLNHLSTQDRLTTFWQPLFPRISQKEAERWIIYNHSSITNLHVRLHWTEYQRHNRILMRVKAFHKRIPMYLMWMYTWFLTVPTWIIHIILLILFVVWGAQQNEWSLIGKTDDLPSIIEFLYKDIDPDKPWTLNLFGVTSSTLILGIIGAGVILVVMFIPWGFFAFVLSGTYLLILLIPINLIHEHIASKQQSKILSLIYGFVMSTILLIVCGVFFLRQTLNLLLAIAAHHRHFISSNSGLMEAFDTVWTHYPNHLFSKFLEIYIMLGGTVWMPISIGLIAYRKVVYQYLQQNVKRTYPHIQNYEMNHIRQHLNDYWKRIHKS